MSWSAGSFHFHKVSFSFLSVCLEALITSHKFNSNEHTKMRKSIYSMSLLPTQPTERARFVCGNLAVMRIDIEKEKEREKMT